MKVVRSEIDGRPVQTLVAEDKIDVEHLHTIFMAFQQSEMTHNLRPFGHDEITDEELDPRKTLKLSVWML